MYKSSKASCFVSAFDMCKTLKLLKRIFIKRSLNLLPLCSKLKIIYNDEDFYVLMTTINSISIAIDANFKAENLYTLTNRNLSFN